MTVLAGVGKSVLKKALAAGEPGRDFRPGMCYCDKGKLETGNRQKGAGRLNEWPERGDSIERYRDAEVRHTLRLDSVKDKKCKVSRNRERKTEPIYIYS